MKHLYLLILLIFFNFLIGCDIQSKGYEHGFKGKSKPIFYSVCQNYHKGYNQGRLDAEMFDYGYYDAKHRLPLNPKEMENPAYLDGYKKGGGVVTK